ncbi:S-adenosyl-L-methionine-dependent methyltransferase [Macrophomina phaseolina]|uniref:S-adenosyl-L-methionine-dependent methyltransferase n=1 Tax=Macrophomina phaseolina TaxID=35725 RepID=A0ABQ8GUC0_9PEZI|nr:S-adenosyl-L-methionine-dependent methyltransferase [Macrophomina phaseolina]
MSSNFKALVNELSKATESLPEDLNGTEPDQRKHILDLMYQIRSEIEQPHDRVYSYVECIVEMGALRLFMDWNGFAHIPQSPKSISYADLAEKLDAEERLVRRIGWVLALRGIRKEDWGAWFRMTYDGHNRTSIQWRQFFAKYGRKEPVNAANGNPTSFAHGQEDKSFWEIVDAEFVKDFNITMRLVSEAHNSPRIFPWKWQVIAENAHLVDGNTPLVVDVGGGRGHDLCMMRKECPAIPAERMVLQDRQPVIEEVLQLNSPEVQGMKKMSHDFFAEQPVKGALVYFFKRILHDWSDKYCRQILGRTREAMAPESRVLIYDFVVRMPPTYNVVLNDLAMMNLSATDRTEEEWKDLVQSSGFDIVQIWNDPKDGGYS